MGDRHADAVGRDWQEARKDIGLTRPKLAYKLGTTSNTVSRWEREPDVQPAIAYQRQMLDLLADDLSKGCGCLGCRNDAVAVIDHPDHGERTVCRAHVNGHTVKRRVTRV